MSLLQAQNVHYIYQSKYQTVHAIKGIHFAFEGGRFYAIVGKSGCGKTTLLSLLAGLDLPTEGQILYDGKARRSATGTTTACGRSPWSARTTISFPC